jgi:glycine/D-amino acid oxidase-like deaminating enzyme
MGDTALVIGGGFAGMLAARVLSDFFGRVIVCEKDTLANDAYPGAGYLKGRTFTGLCLEQFKSLRSCFRVCRRH